MKKSATIFRQNPHSFDDVATEKQALRALLENFDAAQETLLEQTLERVEIRRKVGQFIAFTLVKPYAGEC